MQFADLVNWFIGAVVVAFSAIVVAKTARGLWSVTVLVARGIYWLLIGWWVARIRRYLTYGF